MLWKIASLHISSHSSDYSKPDVSVWHHIFVTDLPFIYFFYFTITGSVFLAALGLPRYVWAFLQLWRVGTTLHCGAWASHCGGSPCCGAQALGTWASVFVALGFSSCRVWTLELAGFSSCDVQAQ